MSNQLLFVGIVAGLAAAVGLALAFSAISTQSTAQMMDGNMGMTGNQGIMATQSTGAPWQWNQRSVFNAEGMSTADNVQITGVSVTGNNEVAVNLRYDGSETSPAVTIIAITNPMAMHGSMGMNSGMMGMGGMGMMHGGQSGMMHGSQSMMGGYDAAPVWQNNTQWQQWHNQMMAQGAMGPGMTLNETSATWPSQFAASQSQTGSSVLDSGWTSDTTVTVKLEGDGSAYDGGVNVMVFPLTG